MKENLMQKQKSEIGMFFSWPCKFELLFGSIYKFYFGKDIIIFKIKISKQTILY
ncbi:hypothetical protein MASR2M117_20500 [Paludibacter sp.]